MNLQELRNYAGLLRPSVLEQLNPEMVALMNELPKLDAQNKAIVGRMFVHGGLTHAEEDFDGMMRAEIRIPAGEFIWKPAIIVMPQSGDLEVEVVNEDPYGHHAAVFPSNGDKQFVLVPIGERGTAQITLDGPGYYWFASPVGNNVGRGMLGLILVQGDVPPEAQPDRPKQPRP